MCRSPAWNETIIMLVVLALIDVVMISNLLIMVIVGGYETFVSRMNRKATPTSRNGSASVNALVPRSSWPWPSSASAPSTCSRPSSTRAPRDQGADVADHHPCGLPDERIGHCLTDRLLSATHAAAKACHERQHLRVSRFSPAWALPAGRYWRSPGQRRVRHRGHVHCAPPPETAPCACPSTVHVGRKAAARGGQGIGGRTRCRPPACPGGAAF